MRSAAAIIALLGVVLAAGCVSTNPPAAMGHGVLVPSQTKAKDPVPTKDSTIDNYLNYALRNNRALKKSASTSGCGRPGSSRPGALLLGSPGPGGSG